ncbi:TPA: hypothetical protein ACXJUT_001945 [Pseudomonas aeruginosa]
MTARSMHVARRPGRVYLYLLARLPAGLAVHAEMRVAGSWCSDGLARELCVAIRVHCKYDMHSDQYVFGAQPFSLPLRAQQGAWRVIA